MASAFEGANEELIAFVEACDETRWSAIVPGDGWSVGVDAHHCAVGHTLAMSWLERMRRGQDVPGSAETHNAMNAQHAREQAAVTILETVGLLGDNRKLAAGYLRGLRDEESRIAVVHGPSGGHRLTVGQVAGAFAGHVIAHLGRMRSALPRPAALGPDT